MTKTKCQRNFERFKKENENFDIYNYLWLAIEKAYKAGYKAALASQKRVKNK